MPSEAWLQHLDPNTLLTAAEIHQLVQQVFIPLGFTRFRLTGGEPLIRPDLIEIVQGIADLPQVRDLSLTTNGYFLAEKAQLLYDAGLTRINISLDSLKPRTFAELVNLQQENLWNQVWNGILRAYEVGFNPLKLNVVVIPGINNHEVLDLAELTIHRHWHVRFIEFMPIGNADLFEQRQWIPSAEIQQQISDRWGLQPGQVKGSGPAEVFQIPGAQGTLGFISQMSDCFCDRCNRIRLSADGWLRPCLLNETGQVDLRQGLRVGKPLSSLREQVSELLTLKPEINYKERSSGTLGQQYQRTMASIGG